MPQPAAAALIGLEAAGQNCCRIGLQAGPKASFGRPGRMSGARLCRIKKCTKQGGQPGYRPVPHCSDWHF